MRIDSLTPIAEIVATIQGYVAYGEHEEAALLALRYAMSAQCESLYPVSWEAVRYHLGYLRVSSEVMDDAMEIFEDIESEWEVEYSNILFNAEDKREAVRDALANADIEEDLLGDVEEIIDWYINDEVDLGVVYILSTLLDG